MNTWTCKGLALLLSALSLGGCDDVLPIGPATAPEGKALRMADLGRGAVTLVAPSGFCIDPDSLRARFALMARCDTLGADGGGDAPLALITATAITSPGDGPITTQDLGAGAETVLARVEQGAVTLVQVQGTPPNPSLRDTFWRAAGRIGTQIVGLALYQARDAGELGDRAPQILVQTLQRTQDQTVANTVAAAGNSATTGTNSPGNGFLAGLFE